jgi:23S rRNA (cytosine1962-C5)-methyltransferase
MSGLVVRPQARIFHGHDWVYGSEVKKVFGEPLPGDVISLKDFKDRFLGSAIYNPESQIVARRFSRRRQDLDQDFFVRRLRRAWVHREELGLGAPNGAVRCVWSESDGLPGVVLDRYGDQFVLQTLTRGMDQRKELLVEAIRQVFGPSVLVVRNDSPVRAAEGLSPEVTVALGLPRRETMMLDGVACLVDLVEGQKTGLYLDQMDNYPEVARFANGRTVLDCFCNQGGFALHAARAGAREVLAIDSSETAVAAGRLNAQASGLEVQFEAVNVFDYLKKAESGGKRFDQVILDPPSFTKSKKTVGDALRGYKEIHLRALKMLEPGGILATFCCSHHISPAAFREMIQNAANDARRTLRLRARHTQRRDHPVLLSIPETEYLQGLTLEVLSSW